MHNIKDKKLEWKFNTESSIMSTPSINSENIYFGADNGKNYSLKVSDGSKNWEKDIGGEICSSPTISNLNNANTNNSNSFNANALFVGSNNDILSVVNLVNGDIIWNFTAGDVIEYSPATYEGKVFFGSDDGTLYTLNTSNGSLIGNMI